MFFCCSFALLIIKKDYKSNKLISKKMSLMPTDVINTDMFDKVIKIYDLVNLLHEIGSPLIYLYLL